MTPKWMVVAAVCVAASGCSAISTRGAGASVQLANAQPPATCQYLGEAFGSQGNWFTGDFTSNAKLMKGARNDMRNKAAAMGGDYVWVQHQANAHAYGSLGTDNTTVIGNVYRCGQRIAAVARSDSGAASSGMESTVNPAEVVLAAQRASASQGCGDVRAMGPGEFSAACDGGQRVIVRCDGSDCRPVRMVRDETASH